MDRAYRFEPVLRCAMCGAEAAKFRTLGLRGDRPQGLRPGRVAGLAVAIQACGHCGLMFPNPMPIPASIGQHYDVEPEQYWESFREEGHFSEQIRCLRTLLGVASRLRALDVGSGLGQTMLALRRADFETVGLEPSKTFAERSIRMHGFTSDQLVVSSLEDANLPAASFDFVNFGAVLEHLADPSGALEKAAGWLRPGGVIHAEVPSARWLVSRLANLFYRLTGTSFVGNLSPMHRPFHLYEFTLESFEPCCRRLGLEMAHSEIYVCQTYLPSLLDPLMKAVMRLTGTGMQLAVWLRKPAA